MTESELQLLRAEIARLERENAELLAFQAAARVAARDRMRRLRATRKTETFGSDSVREHVRERPLSLFVAAPQVSESQELGRSQVRWNVSDDAPYIVLSSSSSSKETVTAKAYVPSQRSRTPYPPEFEAAWQAFPKRLGSNPKLAAFRAWRARIDEGSDAEDVTAGAARYAAFCKATGILETAFVMQAKRFFGPNEEFYEPWEVPAAPADTPHDGESIFDELWGFVNDAGGWRQVGADFVARLDSRVREALSVAGGLKAIAESDLQGFQAKRRAFGRAYQERRAP